MNDDWFGCPVCGAQVPGRALACPECGADEETGWSEETAYDGVELSGDDEPMASRRVSGISRGMKVAVYVVAVLTGAVLLLVKLAGL